MLGFPSIYLTFHLSFICFLGRSNALTDFTRLKRKKFRTTAGVLYKKYDFGYLSDNVDEMCAELCVNHTEFECRSFYVDPDGECKLSSAGYIHDGEPIRISDSSDKGLFFRKSTRKSVRSIQFLPFTINNMIIIQYTHCEIM